MPRVGNKFQHPAPHLLWSRGALCVFPRAELRGNQIAGQDQVIVNDSHQMRPALELGWGTQARFVPEQRLFVKAITVLLTKTQDIPHRDLWDVGILIANPDEPTGPRIAFAISCLRALYPDDRQVEVTSPFDVQMFPPPKPDEPPLGIFVFPLPIRVGMGSGIIGSQFVPIFARSPFPSR